MTTVAQRAGKTTDTADLPVAASWADTKAVRSEKPMVASMVAMKCCKTDECFDTLLVWYEYPLTTICFFNTTHTL